MAYKKYRRYTKSKQNKRFNKYAYNKTDAKSQSKQIVRLNKKINNVYKSVKPELKMLEYGGEKTVSGESSSFIGFSTFIGGSPNTIFQGDYARFIYFNFRICFNLAGTDLTKGHMFRLIIIQTKYPSNTAITPGELLSTAGSFGIVSPFRNNITARYKILLSKVINVTSDKDIVYRSYNFKKLIGFKKLSLDSAGLDQPRSSIMSFVIAPSTQGEIKYSVQTRLGYIDT